MNSKKSQSSCVFLQTLSAIFFKSNKVGCHFCPDFQGFSSIQNIWGALASALPTPLVLLTANISCTRFT